MKELPWRYRALFVAYQGTFFLFLGGAGAALFAHRIGAALSLLGLTGYLTIHHVLAIAGHIEMKSRPWPELRLLGDRVLEFGYATALGLFMVRSCAAALGQRFGAYLLILGFAGHLAIDLMIGVGGYRRVMNRPWPEVAPLDDEDDW